MQAIAATVTENTTAQQVVILLEQRGETTDSMRLRQKYYTLNAADDALANPLRRDESLLLTASGTMRTILTCIQQRDIRRLYRYLALSDPDTGEARMEYEAFASKWTEYPALTAFDFSGGSVSAGAKLLSRLQEVSVSSSAIISAIKRNLLFFMAFPPQLRSAGSC